MACAFFSGFIPVLPDACCLSRMNNEAATAMVGLLVFWRDHPARYW